MLTSASMVGLIAKWFHRCKRKVILGLRFSSRPQQGPPSRPAPGSGTTSRSTSPSFHPYAGEGLMYIDGRRLPTLSAPGPTTHSPESCTGPGLPAVPPPGRNQSRFPAQPRQGTPRPAVFSLGTNRGCGSEMNAEIRPSDVELLCLGNVSCTLHRPTTHLGQNPTGHSHPQRATHS